jgi:Sulfotransferase family
MRLPNFLVIGAAKSGTTSLHYYLKQHPDVYLPIKKELHYFAYENMKRATGGPGDRNIISHICQSRQAYEVFYTEARAQTAIGEVSPSYLYFSDVGKRMLEELKKPKIIAVLRNPIERAFSQYMHLVRDNRESLGFYDALLAEKGRIANGWGALWRYAESSLYSQRLKTYLDLFGDQHVKIFLYDDLSKTPELVMQELFAFIGVDPSYQIDVDRVYNRSGKPKSRFVADLLAKPNSVKSLAARWVPESLREPLKLRLQNLNTGSKGRIDDRSRAYLKEFFAQDIGEVQRMLDRPLGWLS